MGIKKAALKPQCCLYKQIQNAKTKGLKKEKFPNRQFRYEVNFSIPLVVPR